MLRRTIVFCWLVLMWTPCVWAENEGLADLDQATEIKITAKKQRDLTRAIELCESALEKGLDERNTRFAKQLLASTLCERATLASDAAFARGPEDPLWKNYRTLALADLEKAVTLMPELPDALLVIARLQLMPDGDRQRAAKAIESALAIKGVEPRIRARFLLLSAELEQDNDKKLKLLDEAVELSPNKVEPIRARAMLHVKMGNAEAAAKDFAKAVKLEPTDVEAYQQQAACLARLGRFNEALVAIDKAQQLASGSAMPLAIRAQIHLEMNNLDAAMHDVNQALAMVAGNPYLLTLRADIHKEQGQLEAAMSDVDRALRRDPDLDDARYIRWSILIKQQKLAKVVAEMEEHLKRNPRDIVTLSYLARLYTAQKQPQKAIDIYSSILARDPDDLEALQGRANALLGIGKHSEAVVDFNKAMKADASDPGTLNNLAWVLATSPEDSLRDGTRAIELATKACELTKYEEAHIISTLAAAYAETGDFKKAIEWSHKALEVDKDDQDKSVREALEKELKSFEQGKPWRERLQEGLRPSGE